MSTHQGLPVSGYREQTSEAVACVNRNKEIKEGMLRVLDAFATNPLVDKRWLAVGRTHIEQGFMAANRAIFQPARISLPEDRPASAGS